MDFDLDMSGLLAKLESLGQEVETAGKRRALRAGSQVVERAMYLGAPFLSVKTAQSTSLEPGALRNGIRIYMYEDEGEPVALVGPSAKVEHVARWVEYGHRSVHGGYSKVLANGKTRGPGKAGDVDVAAHPWIRPAFESSLNAAVEAERASLAETIQKAVS